MKSRKTIESNLAYLWTQAFIDKPLFKYILEPLPIEKREEALFWIMRRKARLIKDLSSADLVGEGSEGAFMWLSPSTKGGLSLAELIRAGLIQAPFIIGVESVRRILKAIDHESQIHHKYRSRKTWLLEMAAISSSLQGQGIGSQLLRQTLKRIKDAGDEALVITNNNGALKFYQRNGFELLDETQVDSSQVSSWILKCA